MVHRGRARLGPGRGGVLLGDGGLIDWVADTDAVVLVQRGRTTTLRSPPVSQAGDVTAPTASGSSITILDPDGEPVVDEEDVAVAGDVATYALDATSLELGEGYRVAWHLVVDGDVVTLEQELSIVRCVPLCPVSERTIFRRVPALDPTRQGRVATRTDYQDTIADAWGQITERLAEDDRRVELVVTAARLREPTLLLTLALVYEDLATRSPQVDTYARTAADYRTRYEHAWGRLRFRYDSDDDGDADTIADAEGPLFAR